MATFRFELNNKPTKNKSHAVMLCVSVEGRRKRVKTSIEVKRKTDFNSRAKQENWIRHSEPNHKIWNTTLSRELEKAKQTYLDLKEFGEVTSDKIVADLCSAERTSSFLDYTKRRAQEIYDSGSFRNWKKHNSFINKLEGFLRNKNGQVRDLAFAEVTPSLLAGFEVYMQNLRNEREPDKKLHPNTIQTNFSIFKSLVKRAVDVEGLIKPERNPFLRYRYNGIKTINEKLDFDEIALIEAVELDSGSEIWHSRNYFLFSFYCAGIRVGDLIQLRWCNITSDGRLHYQMGNNHKERDLRLVMQAKEILGHYYNDEAKPTDYIFPLLKNTEAYAKAVTHEEKDTMPNELRIRLFNRISAKNALVNKYLKILAYKAGIEKKLTFHISHHSLEWVAKPKCTGNAELKDLFAHPSLQITETDIESLATSEKGQALGAIFNRPAATPKDELVTLIDKMKPAEIERLLVLAKQLCTFNSI